MNGPKHMLISIAMVLLLVLLGCLGYMVIEKWNFFDSLYMTIINLTTVGYGEVNPVSAQGRIFTMGLLVLGGGCFLYLVGNIIQFLVEGRIRLILGRRKLDHHINKLKNHYIVCGYGRIGRVLTRYLIQKYIDVVVIERNADQTPALDEDGVLYLVGDSMNEKLLERAGIHRARGLGTAVGTDADNVFLVLIARQLNPGLSIVARASQESTKKTLLAAGADNVVSPYDLGARRMAHAILRPTVIKFLEMAFTDESTDIQIEEIRVRPGASLIGVQLRDSGIRQNLDLIIIVIQKADGSMLFNPKADTRFEEGDTVVVMGGARSLAQLSRMLAD